MGQRTAVGRAAIKVCKEYPKASTRTLAEKLLKEHPKLFHSLEQARSRVRYYRGSMGKDHRKAAVEIVERERPAVPPSQSAPVEPHELEHRGKGIICSDLHVPYHHPEAIELMLDHAEAKGHTDFAVINGDFLDCYQLSKFCRDPEKKHFAHELEVGRQMLGVFDSVFDHTVVKFGNHEVRYEHYLWQKAPSLKGIEDFRLTRLLDKDDFNLTFVAHNRVIHAGGLTILHGHEYGRNTYSPVNAARGIFIKAFSSAIIGHHHRSSMHSEQDIRGDLTTCWSTGCLCEMHPEYAPLNKWDHGFALIEFDGEWFDVSNRRIVNGRVT